MGVSNYNRYTITRHAKERYKERINNELNELEILKDFNQIMRESRFLANETHHKQSWFCEERKIVIITDPRHFLVVTIYRSVEEYEDCKDTNEQENEIHPEVQKLMSESAKNHYSTKEKEYLLRIAPLYAEYAERMEKLAKTTLKDAFEKKRNELEELKDSIKRLECEKREVLTGLRNYFVKGD